MGMIKEMREKVEAIENKLKAMEGETGGEQEREEREAPTCSLLCFEPLLPPCHIYQCGTGHLICGLCKPKIQTCPSMCGEPLLAKRAVGVEQMLRERLEEVRRRREEQGRRKRSREEEEQGERRVRMRLNIQ